MSTIDADKVIAPVPGDDPCGASLADDIKLMMLLQKAKGVPEAAMGDSVRPAEEPNWGEVRAEAMDLLTQTKDLWACMLLIPAGLRLGGLGGLSEGLAALRGIVET
jgi:type VI secretion system protein ImpA